ncbi:Flp pilus assembly protein CpaB [Devosia sp.]|uniref:Flp pilus assembly protein CpaB n=1 Tax=Devosia sp. TaxID=1871048 RepID=UPI0037519510
MKPNTLVMLLLAVVFGVAAVFLTNLWLAGQQPTSAAAADENAVIEDTVVVAATPLRFGDKLTADNLREIPWPAASLPSGAFRTRAALLDAKEGDRQVITAIGPNEPVLEWKITGPGQRATLSAVLDDGMKAVSIRVNDVLGVAGFVLPGDRVDVLLTRISNNDGSPYVDVLLQNVKVLAIDQTADDRQEAAAVVKAVTLEVATQDAQKLTLAAGIGQLSLALREVASNAGEVTQRITVNDLVAGVPELAASEPAVPAAPPVAAARSNTQVGVTRGVERSVYDVPLTAR